MAKKQTPTATAGTATDATTKAPSRIFNIPANFNKATVNRRNLPRILKPASVPVEGCVSGKIKAIVDSPSSTVKGFLLHLEHETGEEYLFPCTGTIRQALAPGREKDSKELKAQLEKEIGKTLVAVRKESIHSDKYDKDMFVFDVYTQ